MTQNSNQLRIGNAAALTASERNILAARIKTDIDQACHDLYQETEPRRHLGASIVGSECPRRVWYLFRWFRAEQFSARMLRLFNRGHREEARFIEWLRKAGYQIHDVDPASGDQWRIKACYGHFGGSLDSIGQFPIETLRESGWLIEYKTHKDSSFQKLIKEGVQKSKPTHYRQMCTYGRAYGFRYAIYLAINKNNDDIHVEVVALDWSLGDDMYRRADEIIPARIPPARVAENPTFHVCKRCHLTDICYYGAEPEHNCRSCELAFPVRDGQWYCSFYNANPPPEVIKVGCQNWRRLA